MSPTAHDDVATASSSTTDDPRLHLSAKTPSPGDKRQWTQHHVVLDYVSESALAAAYQEEINHSSTLGPRKKENPPLGLGSPQIEESMEARLERLGRQRPEVFDSIWAEIGFVFSISMSQILTVSKTPSSQGLLLT